MGYTWLYEIGKELTILNYRGILHSTLNAMAHYGSYCPTLPPMSGSVEDVRFSGSFFLYHYRSTGVVPECFGCNRNTALLFSQTSHDVQQVCLNVSPLLTQLVAVMDVTPATNDDC